MVVLCEVCVVWFRFRSLRRYLAYHSDDVPGIYRMLSVANGAGPGHGPVHFLLTSVSVIGFAWDSVVLGWCRPGLPSLSCMAGSIQHFREAVVDAWRDKLCSCSGTR